MKNGSGICLLLVSALMECEYWIMGNPDTNVASKAVNPGLQDIILLQEQTLCGGISAGIWPPSTTLPPPCCWRSVSITLLFWELRLRIDGHERGECRFYNLFSISHSALVGVWSQPVMRSYKRGWGLVLHTYMTILTWQNWYAVGTMWWQLLHWLPE